MITGAFNAILLRSKRRDDWAILPFVAMFAVGKDFEEEKKITASHPPSTDKLHVEQGQNFLQFNVELSFSFKV